MMDYILITGVTFMDQQIRKPDGFESQKLFVQPDYMLKELKNSALTLSVC